MKLAGTAVGAATTVTLESETVRAAEYSVDGYGQGPYGGESSSSLAPTDPDGDGKYEDLNGNGKVDYDDIVVFFKNLYEPAITENESDFDFNGNGRVDYDDFVALLEEV